MFNSQSYPVVGLLGRTISNVLPGARTISRLASTAENGRSITLPSFVNEEQETVQQIQLRNIVFNIIMCRVYHLLIIHFQELVSHVDLYLHFLSLFAWFPLSHVQAEKLNDGVGAYLAGNVFLNKLPKGDATEQEL